MENEKDTEVRKSEGQEPEPERDNVKLLLDGLAAGECKGVKGATAYKIAAYAQQKGLA